MTRLWKRKEFTTIYRWRRCANFQKNNSDEVFPHRYFKLIVCVVIEITLNKDNRCSLISGSGSQVAK